MLVHGSGVKMVHRIDKEHLVSSFIAKKKNCDERPCTLHYGSNGLVYDILTTRISVETTGADKVVDRFPCAMFTQEERQETCQHASSLAISGWPSRSVVRLTVFSLIPSFIAEEVLECHHRLLLLRWIVWIELLGDQLEDVQGVAEVDWQ